MSRRLAALCLAFCLLPAASAAAATTQGGATHKVTPEGGPLDLVAVSLGQTEGKLELVLRSTKPITPQLLADAKGGQICTVFEQGSRSPRAVCVTRRDGQWQLRLRGKRIAGTVSRPRESELRLSFEPDAAKLRVGAADWYVAASAAGCAATKAKQAGQQRAPWSGLASVLASVLAIPCEYRLPRVGTYAGRVWRVVVTGCRRDGASQVSRGPSVKQVALTYDDGPSIYTAGFVRELDKLGVPATFFIVGQLVSARSSLARQILRNGSMIGNHSWNHANLGGGGGGASSQLRDTNAAIRRATGFTPCLFRPPYGSTGSDLVRRVRAQGMTSVLWSVDPSDWRTPGTGAIVSRVLAQTGNGAIILLHDGGGPRSQTLAALPQIVRSLKRRGYRFVTLTDLLGYSERVTLSK